ncbi:UbiA family prenyltransferase [Pseudomonadota bacterium]
MSRADTAVLAVDLDGTLVNTDLLVENLFLFLRKEPAGVFKLLPWLLRGKASFKQKLADAVLPEVDNLPYNEPLIEWLKKQQDAGVVLVLATASDIRIGRAVANHLGIFDEVLGTESQNLSSHRKRDVLVDRFGERGFSYVGNSRADLAVWRSAALIHVANPERRVLAAAGKLGQVGQVFSGRPAYVPTLLKAFRLHQWAKNLLLFVPLLASHRMFEWPLLSNGLLAFVAFGACASSVYLLNDLLDLPEDRKHPSKRNRPLAAGTLPILHSLIFIPGLLLCSFGLALWQLPLLFSVVLLAYFAMTLAYSVWLKRVVMLDVVTLAVLYTIRVIAGAAATGLLITSWIMAFSTFIFLSLAFVKRYTELRGARTSGNSLLSGRGYHPSDFELLASLGGAAGYISVLVLALYINDAQTADLYRSPQWMWLACPLLLYWLSRVWLLAHRGEMHDDPVVFALADRVSQLIGLAFVAVFAFSTL